MDGLTHWLLGNVIFKLILVIGGWDISCEISPQINVIAPYCDKSTLVQVMAWGRQATMLTKFCVAIWRQ